ncbi:hypothetical protein CAPTEDRAFT_212862 [Capitella teleta]|uniref:GTP cyclohydrolase 1 feedback regulatory protein n=1 Tax=Capitella teleta TaxID=283909 RepID=R7V667_CAPTE|nr:hypothetical protein CAPTEDRAFT_212862 [Capitella teleta]|eukprot:ELU11235.1 hypothetical protein CAPTEDRAFT_212862 [Capitella teleta]
MKKNGVGNIKTRVHQIMDCNDHDQSDEDDANSVDFNSLNTFPDPKAPHLCPLWFSNAMKSNKHLIEAEVDSGAGCNTFPLHTLFQVIKMPYVLVSTQTRLENGPCTVGDAQSDPTLMKLLKANLIGNYVQEWRTALAPRQVLDLLETAGYKLHSITGVGHTCVFTCHLPLPDDTTPLATPRQAGK